MVNTNKPLDLKSRGLGESNFSVWSRQWTPEFIVKTNGKEDNRSADYLGNYLFGYYGQGAFILKNDNLKYGAGAAQGFISDKDIPKWIQNIKNGNYGDNKGDAELIQKGITDFEKYNKKN